MILFSRSIPRSKKRKLFNNINLTPFFPEPENSKHKDIFEKIKESFPSTYSNSYVTTNGFISSARKIISNQYSKKTYFENIWQETTTRNQFVNILDSLFKREDLFGLQKKDQIKITSYSNDKNLHRLYNILNKECFNDWELTKTSILHSFIAQNKGFISINNDLGHFLNKEDPVDLRWNRNASAVTSLDYSHEKHFKQLNVVYNMEKMDFKHKRLPVFSFLPNEFLKKFNYFHVVDDYKFLCTRSREHLTKRTNCQYGFNSISAVNLISCNPEMMQDVQHDFSTPIKMLRLDKFLSTHANHDFVFEEAKTKKSFLKRPGTVIPVLFKQNVTYRTETGHLAGGSAYIACLLVNLSFERLTKYTAPLVYLNKLFTSAFSKEIIKYTDPDLHKQMLKDRSKHFVQYSYANSQNYNVLSELIGAYPDPEDISTSSIISKKVLTDFVKVPNVSPVVKKKKNKITAKYNIAKDALQNYRNTTNNLTQTIASSNRDIKEYEESIRRANERIQLLKSEVSGKIEKMKALYATYSNSYQNFASLKEAFNTANQEYEEHLQKSIEEEDSTVPSFFSNYEDSDYEIIEIVYTYKDDYHKTRHKITDVTKNFIKDFSKEIIFHQVTFQTTRPFKIIPDNKPQKAVVGGPWICKVTPSNLYVKLRNQSSFFGICLSNRRLQVHPHASKTPVHSVQDYLRLFNHWENACLGEAQPLIYNAFKQNDLSMIITACSIWLKSANSTDMWGKYYKEFLPWSEYETSINDEKQSLLPTEEEIVEAIDSHNMEEHTLQEPTLPEQPATVTPVIPEQPVQEQPVQTNNPVYVRYTSAI